MGEPTTVLELTLAFAAGCAAGAFFYWGLWWTVPRTIHSKHPVLWMMGSFALRAAAVLALLGWVGGSDWRRYAAALVGFVLARFACMAWLNREAPEKAHE